MSDHRPPEIDMLPDGRFRRPPRTPIVTRIFIWAAIIGGVAAALAVSAFALWVALTLLPIAIIAGVIAWLAFRFQLWRTRRDRQGRQDVWRP